LAVSEANPNIWLTRRREEERALPFKEKQSPVGFADTLFRKGAGVGMGLLNPPREMSISTHAFALFAVN
jgi:hypothetical protein